MLFAPTDSVRGHWCGRAGGHDPLRQSLKDPFIRYVVLTDRSPKLQGTGYECASKTGPGLVCSCVFDVGIDYANRLGLVTAVQDE